MFQLSQPHPLTGDYVAFSRSSHFNYLAFPPRTGLAPPFPLPSVDSSSVFSRAPFHVPDWLYHASLDVRVPLILAAIYEITVQYYNSVNKKRGWQPWGFARSKTFKRLVVLHNLLLAVYSGWTVYSTSSAVMRSIAAPSWSAGGWVDTVDTFCHYYNTSASSSSKAASRLLLDGSTPASALVNSGALPPQWEQRLWHEGLAFYGWLFYMSKFYEFMDTAVLIAKGKKASALQSFHHFGAVICAWTAVRYMAPAMIFAVCVNTFIHTIMYTYYALTSFIRIPTIFKRILTTMQIIQLSTGTIFALSGVFLVIGNKQTGERTYCMENEGQTFAVWISSIYFVPLVWLFVKFFISRYIRVVGEVRGKVNGVANGKANGVGNGHANGKANGIANGRKSQ